MTRFLVSLDGSDNSHKAFQLAQSLYKPGDIMHILTIAKPNEALHKAEDLLQKYEDLASINGMKNERVVLRSSDVREGIERAIQDYSIDILILGTRGMGPLKKIFISSVSDHCMKNACCDVIIAK
ncbi:hypothetical protein CYY_001196 [Polysphondylium violaceum]|uniref:UspA domain-containing protein n=1 Tax=Polysphondylium violaceum TaxID=133409 RepID=A0A8J4Q2E5_9MYCE|nr:hypothetical protein CYY_001196 [Polysphondylium violaceum]